MVNRFGSKSCSSLVFYVFKYHIRKKLVTSGMKDVKIVGLCSVVDSNPSIFCFVTVFFKYLYFIRIFYFEKFPLLLHYIAKHHFVHFTPLHFLKICQNVRNCLLLRDLIAVCNLWTSWFFSMKLFNLFANRIERFVRQLNWSDCSCSWVDSSLIQMM